MGAWRGGFLSPGLRLLLTLSLLVVTASCAQTPVLTTVPAGRDECCASIERYPKWLIRAADPAAPLIGKTIGAVNWRHGHLARYPALRADLSARLRPLDILITGHEGRLSNRLIPGLFTHALTYLGDERDLRRMGLWDDPAVKPHHDDIRAGRTIIHSDSRGVKLITPDEALDVDRVVVLRPVCALTPRRKQAELMFFSHLGGKFDYRFDSGEDRRLYCVELIAHAMPYLNLPTRQVYGRTMIVPDEVLSKTVLAGGTLRFVRYLDAGPNGVQDGGLRELENAITLAWR